jgi:hypothetical protein
MREFSLEGYRHLLHAFATRGYLVRGFADAQASERHLILRHDIDISPEAALPIARVEAEIGHRATYFVLVRSALYNAFSAESMQAIENLAAFGHEIGLHFDASLYGGVELEDAAARECAALETMFKVKIETISFHRPGPSLCKHARTIAGRRHAYEPRFVGEMGYCSDSRGGWHHGHPLDHDAIAQGRAMQLLTHPIWWQSEAAASRLDTFLNVEFERLDRSLAANCQIHVPGRARIVR